MTIEQLRNLSLEQLEAMSDKELTEHCRPHFEVTRPQVSLRERKAAASADKSSKNNNNKVSNNEKQKKLEAAKQMARKLGIDI